MGTRSILERWRPASHFDNTFVIVFILVQFAYYYLRQSIISIIPFQQRVLWVTENAEQQICQSTFVRTPALFGCSTLLLFSFPLFSSIQYFFIHVSIASAVTICVCPRNIFLLKCHVRIIVTDLLTI